MAKDGTESLSIAFTLIYTFAFREATKRAAGWGAFQFPADNKDLRLKKFLCTSLPILGGLPLLFYWLSLKVISQLSIDTGDRFLVDLLWMIPLIALLGFFPRTAKNLWNLVAHYKGQPIEGWINKGMESDLPHLTYSWQVVVLLGTVQVGLLLYMLLSQQVSFDNFREKDLPQLFVMFYVSEMIVLHHRAKSLNYFYPEANPKALLAWRTIPSVFVSVLSPIIFAILCSPWVLWLTDANDCCFWVGLGAIAPRFALSFLLQQLAFANRDKAQLVETPAGTPSRIQGTHLVLDSRFSVNSGIRFGHVAQL